MAEDYSGWLTKQEIMKELGLSERTLERMLQRDEIKRAHRRVPGRKPITVISPDDIERLRAEVVKPEPIPAPEERALAVRQRSGMELLALLRNTAQVPALPLFLSVKEASEFSGLSQALIRRLITQKKLKKVWLDRGYRISRKELETLT
jgi:excisionase family DNA binding protein